MEIGIDIGNSLYFRSNMSCKEILDKNAICYRLFLQSYDTLRKLYHRYPHIDQIERE